MPARVARPARKIILHSMDVKYCFSNQNALKQIIPACGIILNQCFRLINHWFSVVNRWFRIVNQWFCIQFSREFYPKPYYTIVSRILF